MDNITYHAPGAPVTFGSAVFIGAEELRELRAANAELDAAWEVARKSVADSEQYARLADAIEALFKRMCAWQATCYREQHRAHALEDDLKETRAYVRALESRLDNHVSAHLETKKRLKECQATSRSEFDVAAFHEFYELQHELAETKRKLATAERSLADEFDKRRSQEFLATTLSDAVNRITAERDEQAAIVADVDNCLATAHKRIDELKTENQRLENVCANERKVAVELAKRCTILEKRSDHLYRRLATMRNRLVDIRNGGSSRFFSLRDVAQDALNGDDEFAKEQVQACGNS